MTVNASASNNSSDAGRFQIFRTSEAPHHELVVATGMTEVVAEGYRKLREAGGNDGGHEIRVLIDIPGFSITYCWFKSNYPLPRHSHKSDCLYYIVGGSLKMGADVLGKGDGFFVPAETPYAYTIGPEGVEVLEFRHEAAGDIHYRASNPAFWAKAAESCEGNRARWATEQRPTPTLEETAQRKAVAAKS